MQKNYKLVSINPTDSSSRGCAYISEHDTKLVSESNSASMQRAKKLRTANLARTAPTNANAAAGRNTIVAANTARARVVAGFKDSVQELDKQCFLLEHLEYIVKKSGWDIRRRGYGASAPGMIRSLETDKPLLAVSALTTKTNIASNFNSLGTALDYSHLTPYVHMYKVVPSDAQYRPNGEITIPFSTHFGDQTANVAGTITDNINTVLLSRYGRSDDVSLLSFDYDFYEGHPAAMGGRVVKAEVKFLFENADSLVAPRGSDEFRYIDLFAQGGLNWGGSEIYEPENYELRAVVGYSVNQSVEREDVSKAFLKAANNSRLELLLAMEDYNLEFTESGMVILALTYAGSIEQKMSGPDFNVFGDDELRKYMKIIGSFTGPLPASFRALAAQSAHSTAMQSLNEIYGPFRKRIWDRICAVDISDENMKKYFYSKKLETNKPGSGATGTTNWNAYHTNLDDYIKDSQEVALGEIENNHNRFHFLYLGDIMSALLCVPHISDYCREHNISFLLGQVMMPPSILAESSMDNFADKALAVPLVDIPISLETFQSFFNGLTIEQLTSAISVSSFIKKMLSDLVFAALGARCKFTMSNAGKTSKIGVSHILAKNDSKTKSALKGVFAGALNMSPIAARNGRIFFRYYPSVKEINQAISANDILISTDAPSEQQRKDRQTIIFIHATDGLDYLGNGNRPVDEERGILHYAMASNTGLVKNITVEKNTMAYAPQLYLSLMSKEDRLDRERSKLWNQWKYSIRLFGTPHVRPYSMMYLDPTWPGFQRISPDQNVFNIGGYCMVLKVANSISVSGWETTVEAAQTQGAAESRDPTAKDHSVHVYPSPWAGTATAGGGVIGAAITMGGGAGRDHIGE